MGSDICDVSESESCWWDQELGIQCTADSITRVTAANATRFGAGLLDSTRKVQISGSVGL